MFSRSTKTLALAWGLGLVATACTDNSNPEVLGCTPACDASACQYCDTTGETPTCVAACADGALCQAGRCVAPEPPPACDPECGPCMHCDVSGGTPTCVTNCGLDTLCQDGQCVAPVAIGCDPGCGPCEMCDTTSGSGVCVGLCADGAVCEAAASSCVSSAVFHEDLGTAGGPLAGPFASAYEVTGACLGCHPAAATEIMASAHWAWAGPTPDLVADDGTTVLNPGTIGKQNLVNNFCIAVPSNEKRCDQCHAGYGGDPDPTKPQKSARAYTSADPATGDSSIPLENRVDCLVCHSDGAKVVYTKDLKTFGLPAPAVDLAAAAQHIVEPTRASCGSCHFYAGGGDNVKLMGSSLKLPAESLDVHMGRGMGCNECHVGPGHSFRGGGTHTPTHTARASCTECHGEGPHAGKVTQGDALDQHTAKIACQTCHIPRFSRAQFAKLDWDWSTAGDNVTCAGTGTCVAGVVTAKVQDDGITPDTSPTAVAVTVYDYIKGSFHWQRNIVPAYRWSSGKATHAQLSDRMDLASAGLGMADAERLSLGEPVGDPADGKITPFKLMRGRQAVYVDGANGFVVNPNLFGPTGFWGIVQAAGWRYDTYDFDGAATSIAGLESFDADGNGAIDPGAESVAALWGKVFAKGAVAAGQLPAATTMVPRWSASAPATAGYDWRYTKLYMDLNHEVAPRAAALGAGGCADCHTDAASAKLPMCELYAGATLPWGVTGCP